MTRKAIIINWGWKDILLSNIDPPKNIWQTEQGHCLVCTNKSGDLSEIHEITKSCLKTGAVLVFLHKNPPHNATEKIRIALYNQLKDQDNAVRVRLFGGGSEPIYFRKNSQGMVGATGTFPSTVFDEETFTEHRPNFILDEDNKRINQEYFDHVWNAYWHTPKNNVYSLMEEFQFYSRGFDWTVEDANARFLTHLADYKSLWHKLHSFAGIPIADNQQSEYAIDAYIAHLQHTNDNITLTLIENIRKDIAQILAGEVAQDEAKSLVRNVYNDLFECFKVIPSYL
jgi:hypothetical protein